MVKDRGKQIASHDRLILRSLKGDIWAPLLLQHVSIRNNFRLYRISS